MRELKFLTVAQLDEYLPIYLNSYPANKSIGDEGYEKYKARNKEIMEKDKETHYVGLYEDGKIIATGKFIDFQINLWGEMKKAVGLMALGVDPMHKKKGAALDMVKLFEKYAKDMGASLALLLPFRIDFYRKMGYGFLTRLHEYHLKTLKLPKAEDLGNCKLLEKKDFPQVLECYKAVATSKHGMIEKFGEEARDMEEDSEVRRIGYIEDGKIKGYAAFNFKSDSEVNYTKNLIDVTELIYSDSKVLRALLGALRLQADLAEKIVLRTGEEDFYHLIDDPADVNDNYIDFGYLETNISAIGIMGKVIDLKKFIEETRHREFMPLELVARFKTYDSFSKEEKSITVEFKKGEDDAFSHWSLTEKEADIVVKCRENYLASLLLGGAELAALIRLGVVEIEAEGEDFNKKILGALLHCEEKPFSNTDF